MVRRAAFEEGSIEPKSAALAAFLNRLILHSDLSEQEQQAVLDLPARSVGAQARQDLVKPGSVVNHAILVGRGLLARFDIMKNGTRQITALHLPGDMCDLQSVISPVTGWGVTALCGSEAFYVPHSALLEIADRFPNLAFAFWRDTVVDASILAKWIANIGRKNAASRLSHLFCEIAIRTALQNAGSRRAFQFDITQEQLADITGLTNVHVNRTLNILRTDGIVEKRGRLVEIHDWDRLAALAEFTSTYLLFDKMHQRRGNYQPNTGL